MFLFIFNIVSFFLVWWTTQCLTWQIISQFSLWIFAHIFFINIIFPCDLCIICWSIQIVKFDLQWKNVINPCSSNKYMGWKFNSDHSSAEGEGQHVWSACIGTYKVEPFPPITVRDIAFPMLQAHINITQFVQSRRLEEKYVFQVGKALLA